MTFVDPITRRTRLISVTENGVYSAVDGAMTRIGNGEQLFTGIGFTSTGDLNRSGNLQIAQFYAGAVQPSQLAADVAGALYYGMSLDNGFPVSSPDILTTGNVQYTTADDMSYGRGTGVATDPTGSGTAYQFRFPVALDDPDSTTDRLLPRSPAEPAAQRRRVQRGPTACSRTGQPGPWTSASGRASARRSGTSRSTRSTTGLAHLVVGRAGSSGAPTRAGTGSSSASPGPQLGERQLRPGGRVRGPEPGRPRRAEQLPVRGQLGRRGVRHPGPGGTPWTNVSAGLAGSGAIMQIIPNPRLGTTDAYLVAQNGVYYNPDVFAVGSAWEDITNQPVRHHPDAVRHDRGAPGPAGERADDDRRRLAVRHPGRGRADRPDPVRGRRRRGVPVARPGGHVGTVPGRRDVHRPGLRGRDRRPGRRVPAEHDGHRPRPVDRQHRPDDRPAPAGERAEHARGDHVRPGPVRHPAGHQSAEQRRLPVRPPGDRRGRATDIDHAGQLDRPDHP